MKNYIVYLDGNRTAFVKADTYQEVGGKLLFYIDGTPIADIYFEASVVDGVNVEPEDDEPGSCIAVD